MREELRALLAEVQQLLAQAEVEDPQGLAARRQLLELELDGLRAEQLAAGECLDRASAEVQEGHRRLALAAERDAAAALLDGLQQRVPAMESHRTALEQARRADRVLPAAQRLREAEELVARLLEEEVALVQQQDERERVLGAAQAALAQAEAKEPRREDLRRTIARLRELEPQLQQLEASRGEMRAALHERLDLEAELERLQRRLEDLEASLAPLRARQLEAQSEAAKTEHLEYQRLQNRKQRGLREEVDKVFAEARAAEELHRSAEASSRDSLEALERARLLLQLLQKRWNTGQSAILASLLEPGCPCPVCGSPDHPSPAAPSGNLPSETDLKAAQDQVQSADYSSSRASGLASQKAQDLEKLRGRFEALREALGDRADEPMEAIAAQETELRRALEVSLQAARELEPLQAKIVAQERSREDQAIHMEELRERRAAAQGREATARGAVQVLESQLLEDLRVPGMLSTQLERASQNLADLEQELQAARLARETAASLGQAARANLEAHRGTLRQASTRVEECTKAFGEALAEARFWERRDFERACLARSDQERLERELQAHGEALAAANDRHQRALAQAGTAPAPDLAALQACLELAMVPGPEHRRAAGQEPRHPGGLGAVARSTGDEAGRDRPEGAPLRGPGPPGPAGPGGGGGQGLLRALRAGGHPGRGPRFGLPAAAADEQATLWAPPGGGHRRPPPGLGP